MAVKRGHVDLDPDYEDVTEQQTKRQRVLEEDAKEATRRKIENIIHRQFSVEIENKEDEVDAIDQRLNQSRLVMDRLRACVIANFYSKAGQQKFSQVKQNPNEPPCIHPTVKEHIGKAPRNYPSTIETSDKGNNSLGSNHVVIKKEPVESTGVNVCLNRTENIASVPDNSTIKQENTDGRSSRFKTKKRIVVGNVSKYIPVDRREENDQSTHKWMVYVRGSKEEPRIDHFVKKVWFFLHPSYRPNDLVEVSQPPFHLTRRGWGEFPVRVQLHFKDQRNKRVDVIHQLKLDRTYTGLQTLGSETLVDVELEKEIQEEKMTSSSMPTTFDLKNQLKGDSSVIFSPEKNITITEHHSPLKKLSGTSGVNGTSLPGEESQIESHNNGNIKTGLQEFKASENISVLMHTSNQIQKTVTGRYTPDSQKGQIIVNSLNSSGNTQSVQLVLGGVGSVSNPNFPNSKGDDKNIVSAKGSNPSNGKGDNVACQKTAITNKEQNSAVILQGIGSLSTKIAPSQNQMRLTGGTSSKCNLIIKSCPPNPNTGNSIQLAGDSIVSAQLPKPTPLVTVSAAKTNTSGLQLHQQVPSGSTLILQPNVQTTKSTSVVVRPTVQKPQSSMLLIQSVPMATRTIVPTQQTAKQNLIVGNQTHGTTKPNVSVVPPAVRTSLIIQPSQLTGSQHSSQLTGPTPTTKSTVQLSQLTGSQHTSQLTGPAQTTKSTVQLSQLTGSQHSSQLTGPTPTTKSTVQLSKPINTLQTSQAKTGVSLLQQPQTPATTQTLYYRCKDSQGNIFLVPQQLLKQVVQSPTTSTTQTALSSSILSVTPSTKSTTQTSALESKATAPFVITGGKSATQNMPAISNIVITTSTVSNTTVTTVSSSSTISSSGAAISSVSCLKSTSASQILFTPPTPNVIMSQTSDKKGTNNVSSVTANLNITATNVAKPTLTFLNTGVPTVVTGKGTSNQNSPITQTTNQNPAIVLNMNHTGKVVKSSQLVADEGKSLLKCAKPPGEDINLITANSLLKLASSTCENVSKTQTVGGKSGMHISSNCSQQQNSSPNSGVGNSANSPLKVSKPLIITTSQNISSPQKSSSSLLLTMNTSNGKKIVMPSQNFNSNHAGGIAAKPGTSLLLQTTQKTGTSQNTQKQDVCSNGIMGKLDPLEKSSKTSTRQVSILNPTITNTKTSTTVAICSNSLVQSQGKGQITSKGQLQVTPQGLKVVDLSSKDNSSTPSPSQNLTLKQGKVITLNSAGIFSKEVPVIKPDNVKSSNLKGHTVSLLSKEFQKPVISSSNPASLLASKKIINRGSSLINSQSSVLNSTTVTPSLTLTSEIKGQNSLLSSSQRSISAKLGEKNIVIDLASELKRNTGTSSMEMGQEKRIICLRKKSEQKRPLSPPTVLEEIKPLRVEDYPDLLSLVRAAVKRHPVVSLTADKYQHPYCASTSEEWLSWRVGKRRASEWQRASFCRKFIKDHVKADTYKGTKLWTTKQIMLWCRLHAFSPHYLESTLHPFGVELTADRIGKKFCSATCPEDIIVTDNVLGSRSEDCDEEEIDIINIEQTPRKKKEQEKEETVSCDTDIIPPSDTVVYIQDSCQKIGITFSPTELQNGVYGSPAEDMIFSVMKSFIGDVLTETFAGKVSNDRYPDSLGMTDVFQALNNMSQADFLTNHHLGVKVTDNSAVHR